MSKMLDIDGGNNPTTGKRLLFFMRRGPIDVKGWPAKILDNYGSTRRCGQGGDSPNQFCESPPSGQVVYQIKVETPAGDIILDAYADSSRTPGSFDEYKEGDLRV